MKAVITGDIVNSSQGKSEQWMKSLKSVLCDFGPSPSHWEIYRGDSFQLMIDDVSDCLLAAIRIKASIKTMRGLDARMAIGIGTANYIAENVTESNGPAFVRSGKKFESLKREKSTLSLSSPWEDFDDEMNLYFRLALIAIDDWSEASAEFIAVQLVNREKNQDELSTILGIGQSSVSERKKRAHYDEIIELEKRFRSRIKSLI